MTTIEATNVDGGGVDTADARTAARSLDVLRDVYAEHYVALTRFAVRLTGSVSAAEDVVQEAFARLLGRRLLVRQPVPFLYRTVGNLATDLWRRNQRDARLGRALGTPPDVPACDPAVHDAVRRLPNAERTAITLYYFADLPVPDVAALMNRPAGTVRRLLSSARDRLAHQLGEPHA